MNENEERLSVRFRDFQLESLRKEKVTKMSKVFTEVLSYTYPNKR